MSTAAKTIIEIVLAAIVIIIENLPKKKIDKGDVP